MTTTMSVMYCTVFNFYTIFIFPNDFIYVFFLFFVFHLYFINVHILCIFKFCRDGK